MEWISLRIAPSQDARRLPQEVCPAKTPAGRWLQTKARNCPPGNPYGDPGMLILSRKANQKILFPQLGIAVQVMRVDGNTVRVGVEAPDDVQVLRDEVAARMELGDAVERSRLLRHQLRNRLNAAHLALHLTQQQLAAGQEEQADRSLQRALEEFNALDKLMAAQSAAAGPIAAAKATSVRPVLRALVVEDNPHECELLAAFLRLNGYAVDTVRDGEEALNYLAEKSRPDVVLLDMQMPRLDGPQTIAAIRGNPSFRGLKVMAVSGGDRALQTRAQGIDRWFSKPLNPTRFLADLQQEISSVCSVA